MARMGEQETERRGRSKGGFPAHCGTLLRSTILAAILLLACRAEPDAPAGPMPLYGTGIRTVRLLTYNVYGEIEPSRERMRALLETIRRADADVIALQEAKSWMIRRFLEEPWVRALCRPAVSWSDDRHGDLFFFSRFPIVATELVRLPTVMGRNILAVTVIINGRRVRIGNIHLESFLMAYSMRADQLDRCFAVLARESDDAILMGDFNFGDDEPLENGRIPRDWRDPWRILRPRDPGYTWDIRKSHWARRTSFDGEGSRRLDRIIFRSGYWHPAATDLIGNEPYVPGNPEFFPSDHFGLVSVLTAGTVPGDPARPSVGPSVTD